MKSLIRAFGGLFSYRTSTKPAQSEENNVQNELIVETSPHGIPPQDPGERLDEDLTEPQDSHPPDHSQANDDDEDNVLPYIRPSPSGLASILATNSPARSAKSLDDSPKLAHSRRSIQFTTDATAEKPSSIQTGTRHKTEDGTLHMRGTGSKRSSLIVISPPHSPQNSALNLSSIQQEADDEKQEIQSELLNIPLGHWDRSLSEPLPDLAGRVKQLHPFAECEGSHSSVFIGQLDSKKVAIKVFRGMRFTSETSEKVKEEREIWWQLDHENVLPLLGFSEQFGRYGALIYPWCEGGNTSNYLRKPGNASERFQLWYGVVKAICYLHSHEPQVIHGDLKPANVLISEGKTKVCDFGLLKLLAEETMGMTTTSAHIGTMRYLARELVVADDPPTTTSHTDVYALGCLGLEFLFLRIPYADRRNPAQIFKDIADNVPPSKILPLGGEPAKPIKQLWDELNQCWNPDPAKRPTAQELQRFIEANEGAIMGALEKDFIPAPGLLE